MLPVVVFTLCLSSVLSAPSRDPQLDEHWDQWKDWHKKNYNETEEGWRRGVWEKNLKMIEMHNLEHSMGKHTYRLGMNHFGDMTNEEVRQMMACLKPSDDKKTKGSLFMKPSFLKTPSSVDWRQYGYVTPVENQVVGAEAPESKLRLSCPRLDPKMFPGQPRDLIPPACPGVGVVPVGRSVPLELLKGNLVSLSKQNLVDCTRPWGNFGCNGGWMNNAFQYVKDNGGLDSEASYPYVGTGQQCHYDSRFNSATVTGLVNITKGSENDLMDAVAAVGPVSVAIDASHSSFIYYSSGIYYEPSCSSSFPVHAMLVVGYSSEQSQDYWIIKNSWGTTWGEAGYIRMAKDRSNNCGVASYASYPLV